MRRWFIHARGFLDEVVVFAVMRERRFAPQPAAFDAEMVLRDRKRIFATNFCYGDAVDRFAVGHGEMRVRICAQEVRVEPGVLSDWPNFLATVTERDRHRMIGVPRK